MLSDLKNAYELVEQGKIPIWLLVIFIVSIIVNILLTVSKTLIPYFQYRLEKYKIKKEEERKSFENAERRIGDLKERKKGFVSELTNLSNKIKEGSINQDSLNRSISVFDDFFDDIMIICEGVEKGFVAKTGNVNNIVTAILKHKYDKKDNLIVDIHNAIKKSYTKLNMSFDEPVRISKYEILFRSYKKNLPFYKRFFGIFIKKALDIK